MALCIRQKRKSSRSYYKEDRVLKKLQIITKLVLKYLKVQCVKCHCQMSVQNSVFLLLPIQVHNHSSSNFGHLFPSASVHIYLVWKKL